MKTILVELRTGGRYVYDTDEAAGDSVHELGLSDRRGKVALTDLSKKAYAAAREGRNIGWVVAQPR